MLNRTAIVFPLVLAGLMALLTFWIYQTVEQQGPKIDGSDRHDPDYIMENFVTTQTDSMGKLRYVLAAAKMSHYPDDDSSVLEEPKFTQYASNKPYTKIKGSRANVSSDGEEIEILDNVVVIRQKTADKGEMQVLTDKLTLFPNQDLAKTDSPVVIKQAPKTIIHATGMIYDKNKKTLQLFKRVNAHYEKPKSKTKRSIN
jgi:lipopolysaccharide export system protein LptC